MLSGSICRSLKVVRDRATSGEPTGSTLHNSVVGGWRGWLWKRNKKGQRVKMSSQNLSTKSLPAFFQNRLGLVENVIKRLFPWTWGRLKVARNVVVDEPIERQQVSLLLLGHGAERKEISGQGSRRSKEIWRRSGWGVGSCLRGL